MLVGFGGKNAAVVAAVLVFRFLTMVPTLLLGLLSAFTLGKGRRFVLRNNPSSVALNDA